MLRYCLKLKEEDCIAETLFAALSVFIEDKLYKLDFLSHVRSQMQHRTQLSPVSLLPQGVLDLVLDILGYGSLVDGVVRVDGCCKNTFAVPMGHLVLNQKCDKSLKVRFTVE